MPRDRTARTRIRNHLAMSGPVVDPSGYATGALMQAIDYTGSSVAFIQLIAAMDRDGELDREIKGKRTYAITGVGSATAAQPTSESVTGTARVAGMAEPVTIDYDRLARAMVRELISHLAPAPVPEAQVDDDRLTAERNDYANRLEVARRDLDELLGGLTEEFPERTPSATTVKQK